MRRKLEGEHDQHHRQHELGEVPPGVDVVAHVAAHRALVAGRQAGVVAGEHRLAGLGQLLVALGLVDLLGLLAVGDDQRLACGPPPGPCAWAWAGSWPRRAAGGARRASCVVGGLAASEHAPTVGARSGCRARAARRARAAVGRVGRVTDVLPTDQISALRDRVAGLMPGLRADLEALTRIPSVSLDAFDQAHVEASAEATAALLRAEGLDVEIVREGGRPAVIGHVDGPARVAHRHALRAPRRAAPRRRDALGQPAVRAHRARRAALRPRRRRRQGRDHGARGGAAGPRRGAARSGSPSSSRARRRSARDSLADHPRAARREAAGRRHRACRLRPTGRSASRPSPPPCAA